MTNYEKLFKDQMNDPQFAKAYYEARLERFLNDIFEDLREKITNDEPKEVLLETIDSIKKQLV